MDHGQRDRCSRSVFAIGAVTLTGLIFLPFMHRLGPTSDSPAQIVSVRDPAAAPSSPRPIAWVHPAPARAETPSINRTRVSADRDQPPPRTQTRRPILQSTSSRPEAELSVVSPEVHTRPHSTPPEPTHGADRPLDLSSATIARAIREEKSGIRRQAQAIQGDGTGHTVPGLTPLSEAIAEAGRPDCLRPGGSLLSIFIIAFEVTRDRCK